MPWAEMLIGKAWKFTGPMSQKKLVEIFVELHYIFYGRPNDSTVALMFKYCRELETQYPRFTVELRGKH